MHRRASAITPTAMMMVPALVAGVAGAAVPVSGVACYDHSDPAIVEMVLKANGAQAPTWVSPLLPRLAIDTFSWRDEANISLGGRAQRASLTYSFVPDAITWGLEVVSTPGPSTGPSELTGRLQIVFGAGNQDLGREYIRQSLAAWGHAGGISYREVADDGSPMTETTTRSALRGDIRIGGVALGVNGVLAYNAFPSANGEIGIGGGDMLINTSYFGLTTFNNPANDYLVFRNTVTHEHGHGLGLIHVVPCNGSKLMEPFVLSTLEGVQTDDRRSVARMNGDRYAGNVSPGAAANLGNLSTPVLHSRIERGLSTNGAGGFGNTDEDYFRFTIDAATDMVITATPTGGIYDNQQQTLGCLLDDVDVVDANRAGNLTLELRNSAGTSVIASSASAPAGMPESLSVIGLPAGSYVVKVADVGPNSAVNQLVQLYDLELRAGGTTAAPVAVAGVDKRVAANTNCFFIGDLNSYATESGAVIDDGAFEWDLDGDGTFETLGARPMIQYVSNGEFTATLRVADDLGMTADDSITVTVTGAVTTLSAVAPVQGNAGTVVPVVLSGTNLLGVDSAADVSVSGGGVTVIGVPVVNGFGSEITGLSLMIDAGAIGGARDVVVSTPGGPGVAIGAFTIVTDPVDPADFNSDGVVDASDLADLLAAWGACMGCPEDLDGDGMVGASDLAALLAAWGN